MLWTSVVFWANLLIALSAAAIGALAYLQRRALSSDAVAHAVLPGVCLGFLLSPMADSYWTLVGGIGSGGLAMLVLDALSRQSRMDYNTSIAVTLATFYAGGIILLSEVQDTASAGKLSLNNLMFGNAAALRQSELYAGGVILLLTFCLIYLYRKPLQLYILDSKQARVQGINFFRIRLLVNFLLLVNVAMATYSAGMILTGAFVVAPAVTARFWLHRFYAYLGLALLLSCFAVVVGLLVSYHFEKSPSGPYMVLALFVMLTSSAIIQRKRSNLRA